MNISDPNRPLIEHSTGRLTPTGPATALSKYLGAPAIPGDFQATHGIDVDRLGWCVLLGFLPS